MAQRSKKRLKMDRSRQRYNIGILFFADPKKSREELNRVLKLDSRTIKRGRCSFARKFTKCLMIESLHCIP
jgi:hypothetical protein